MQTEITYNSQLLGIFKMSKNGEFFPAFPSKWIQQGVGQPVDDGSAVPPCWVGTLPENDYIRPLNKFRNIWHVPRRRKLSQTPIIRTALTGGSQLGQRFIA